MLEFLEWWNKSSDEYIDPELYYQKVYDANPKYWTTERIDEQRKIRLRREIEGRRRREANKSDMSNNEKNAPKEV